jgi:hypothetical protein
MDLFICDKCGKECKDKRGLTVHSNKCTANRHFICEFCNLELSTSYNLSVHITRCKTLKTQKELMTKEEILSLQSDLQTSKNEIVRLLRIQQETKDTVSNYETKIKDIQYDYENKLKIYQSNQQSELKDKESIHQKELSDLKTALQNDFSQQLKIRDNDLSSYHKDIGDLTEKLRDKEQQLDDLKEVNKTLLVDNRTLINTMSTLSLKDTTTNNTIINQPSYHDNRIQLQCFDPSMIQGRINPPNYVIGNVDDLVGMLRSQGVRNCFRVNDKSRGTISWNKPGEGEIRDPNAEQFLTHVIDSLNSDLIKEKSYYEEELKALCSADDLDMYQIDESRGFVNFCSELLKKKPETLKKIKRELIKQGKSKNDPEVDQVHDVTYTKFVTSIILALFPNILDWIDKSFYEIGRLLASKTKDYYHTEGASRHKLYIVIHSDNNTNKRTESKHLISYLSEAMNCVFDSELVERSFENILITHKGLNAERVQDVLNYIKNPSIEVTKEIMRGLIA